MPKDPSIASTERREAPFFEGRFRESPNMLLHYSYYHTTKKSENPTDFTGVTRKYGVR